MADPAFKMAVGRAPESGRDLCSQPTMCRLENLPVALTFASAVDDPDPFRHSRDVGAHFGLTPKKGLVGRLARGPV